MQSTSHHPSCTTQLHEARKLLPLDWYYADPQEWPEANLILLRCRLCNSHVAVVLDPALDEEGIPTMIKEAL